MGDGAGEPVLAVVVIAFEASSTIEALLDRVPLEALGAPVRLLVADDASSDDTTALAEAWVRRTGRPDATVVRRDVNLGYGGNQRAAYQWAIDTGVDAVAVVHGDGQYPPEVFEELVGPIVEGGADAVFASRMLIRGGALRGGMPLERFVGNRALSGFQNLLTGARLSEWHTGLRAYRTSVLAELDLPSLPSGFDFDTAITLRLLEHRARISEIAIPTRYAEEVSHIDLYRTAVRIVRHTVRHTLRHRARVRRGASARSRVAPPVVTAASAASTPSAPSPVEAP